MDQSSPSSSSSSLLIQGHEVEESKDERPASLAQMMEENREALGMKIVAVMVQRYGVLPKEMWDLNSISDMGAGRRITYDKNVPRAIYESIIGSNRYSIVDLTLGRGISHNVVLPVALRRLSIVARYYNYPLERLPENLLELIFSRYCIFNEPLVLPQRLRKLVLSSWFNHPLILPASLVDIQFGDSYNQPTTLPIGIEKVRVGAGFDQNLSFPPSVRKIDWLCIHPVQLPDGVAEVEFHCRFNQPLILPASLKKITFHSAGFDDLVYSQPLDFPSGLQELSWWGVNSRLLLPAGLQKLTWGSYHIVELPSKLRELSLWKSVPFVLPAGLRKVTFAGRCAGRYDLPESVREVSRSGLATFTHPTTLHHLVVKYSEEEIDLAHNRVRKLTIGNRHIQIEAWPQALKELAFTVDGQMEYPLIKPKQCRIVGNMLPVGVVTMDLLVIHEPPGTAEGMHMEANY